MKKLTSVLLAGGILLSAAGNTFAATGSEVVDTGDNYLGTPYQYGAPIGNTSSFDCSSFTAYVFGKHGVDLPRVSRSQATVGDYVSRSNLQIGDLVFFNTNGYSISHVGIYIGNGKMIGATNDGVGYANINSSYWGPRYVTARRVLDEQTVQSVSHTAEKEISASSYTRQTEQSEASTHTVVRGDTLWGLSRKYSTSVSKLKSVNNLSSDMIYVGQKLKVSSSATTTTTTVVRSNDDDNAGSYKIKSGDTLWAISRNHGTSVRDLMDANNLSSSLIYPGQTLVIPN